MDPGRVIQPAEAVQRYVAQFEAFAANGAGAAPAWLRERRAAAVARFAELGFPTTRQEDWRFTSVAPLVDTAFVPAAPGRDAGAGAGVAKAGAPRLATCPP